MEIAPVPSLSSQPFEALWLELHEPLCRFVCSRTANEDDAADILQDVFLRAYHQLGTVRDPERLQSWLYQIARHRLIDHYRSRRQWVELPETLSAEEDLEEGIDGRLIPALQKAVQDLPPAYREALVLADLQGLAQQELAARTSISLSGAKSRVQRARQMVKTALFHCFDFELDPRGRMIDYHPLCCC
jgi:RNA polymerase sigma-70 factor (ECF subfamily)